VSRAAVLAQVQSMVTAIGGVTRVVAAMPEPDIPPTDTPLVIVELSQSRSVQLTFDDPSTHGGVRHDTYMVTMTYILGVPTMPAAKANSNAVAVVEQFLKTFTLDRTLSGTCWLSTWQPPTDNLGQAAYKAANEHPKITMQIEVTEQTTMGH
jgi:hypothetical protein